MSRLPDPEQEPAPDPPGPAGTVGPSWPAVLVGLGLVALVAGWGLRPLSVAAGASAPTISWVPVLALLLVAAIVGGVAWSTHRSLQTRRQSMAAHHAVNRLVLAKACALTGSVVAGSYLGYALSWVGLTEADLARERLVRSLVAGVAGLAIVAGSLLLERACRVNGEDA